MMKCIERMAPLHANTITDTHAPFHKVTPLVTCYSTSFVDQYAACDTPVPSLLSISI